MIGRKCTILSDVDLKDVVVMIDDNPFIFTGTLRDNVDPYHRYTDDRLVEAMKKIGLW